LVREWLRTQINKISTERTKKFWQSVD